MNTYEVYLGFQIELYMALKSINYNKNQNSLTNILSKKKLQTRI